MKDLGGNIAPKLVYFVLEEVFLKFPTMALRIRIPNDLFSRSRRVWK